MAKRVRKSPWAAMVQRSMTAMTRSMLNAGQRAVTASVKRAVKQSVKQAVKQAAKQAVTPTVKPRVRPAARPKPMAAKRAPPTTAASGRRTSAAAARASSRSQAALAPGGGSWSTLGVLGPAGMRRGHLYTPPNASRTSPAPLLVMLHGCGQTAEAFALSTRMNRVAARAGWYVLYPEQDRHAHPQGCWNWYATRNGLAQAEVATLLAAIEQVCLRHAIDPARIAVVGLSAGAGMAVLMANRHPARFRAVVMHSGVPPGAAQSTASALRAMLGSGRAGALSAGTEGTPLPPLLVIHGIADTVVAPENGRTAARLWAEAAGALPGPPRRLQRGQRRSATVTDFRRRGRLAATLFEIDQLAHAWSGGAASEAYGDARGPDASRLAAAFVARQFALALRPAAAALGPVSPRVRRPLRR